MTSPQKRPLYLLFDLDNVLVHKESHNLGRVDTSVFDHHVVGPRSHVWLRPCLVSFFDDLVGELAKRHLDVRLGVWSSMTQKNVDAIVDILHSTLTQVTFEVVLHRTDCQLAPTTYDRYATRKLLSSVKFPPAQDTLVLDNDLSKIGGNPPEHIMQAPEFDLNKLLANKTSPTYFAKLDDCNMRYFAHVVADRLMVLAQKQL